VIIVRLLKIISDMKEFNSQICTSREQSERLLALGLKKETADMVWTHAYYGTWVVTASENPLYEESDSVPAWSLHRLIEMMPTLIGWRGRQYWLDINDDGVCYHTNANYALVEFIADNLYDNIVYCIEWLIKEGYFNKEYLV
jgi:hypothetical protein